MAAEVEVGITICVSPNTITGVYINGILYDQARDITDDEYYVINYSDTNKTESVFISADGYETKYTEITSGVNYIDMTDSTDTDLPDEPVEMTFYAWMGLVESSDDSTNLNNGSGEDITYTTTEEFSNVKIYQKNTDGTFSLISTDTAACSIVETGTDISVQEKGMTNTADISLSGSFNSDYVITTNSEPTLICETDYRVYALGRAEEYDEKYSYSPDGNSSSSSDSEDDSSSTTKSTTQYVSEMQFDENVYILKDKNVYSKTEVDLLINALKNELEL